MKKKLYTKMTREELVAVIDKFIETALDNGEYEEFEEFCEDECEMSILPF